MSDTTADGTVETPKDVDWEARARKAEAKIVADKKATEEPKTTEPTPEVKDTPNFMTRQDFEAERFFEQNTDLVEHKEYIMGKVTQGNTFDEAKFLAKLKDPTIENRKKTKQSNFTTWEAPIEKQSFTVDQLSEMDQDDYNKAMDLVESGKAKRVS